MAAVDLIHLLSTSHPTSKRQGDLLTNLDIFASHRTKVTPENSPTLRVREIHLLTDTDVGLPSVHAELWNLIHASNSVYVCYEMKKWNFHSHSFA